MYTNASFAFRAAAPPVSTEWAKGELPSTGGLPDVRANAYCSKKASLAWLAFQPQDAPTNNPCARVTLVSGFRRSAPGRRVRRFEAKGLSLFVLIIIFYQVVSIDIGQKRQTVHDFVLSAESLPGGGGLPCTLMPA